MKKKTDKTDKKTPSAEDIESQRRKAVRVKTALGRRLSSTRWLQRQLNDPYVAAAKEQGWRSRAAFKLIQLDEKFNLLHPNMRVIDLGAAPGGWSQVVAKKSGKNGKLVAIDLLEMDAIEGAQIVKMDFLADNAPDVLKEMLSGQANLVISDMAPSTTGHTKTDKIRIMNLAEHAAYFALEVLAPNGGFVCKLFQGGAEKDLLDILKQNFKTVKHAKPKASRADSSESYIVALGFKG
ncbi:MAG: RlmE family RNA methyltransferase [Bdellovibrionales bacterium]